MSRVRFLSFPRKKVEIYAAANIWTGRRFWQVVPVQQPVQYGRDAAHISWAAGVQSSLEDCMEERQHHLNESSSARLGRSQKLEILPSPNSKSLGANFLMDAYIWRIYFDRRRDFNVRLVSIVYYVAQQFYNSAQLGRIYFGHAHIFWTCAYILSRRQYFVYMRIFLASANNWWFLQ